MTVPSVNSLLVSCAIAWLQSILGQKIIELFQDERHSGINWRSFASASRGFEAELEIIDNGHESLQQRAVRVLDRVFLFACSALFVILEIGLAAQREIAKPVEVRLQHGHRVIRF